MKTDKISINKTAEQPDGMEIEIVQPENKLEEGALCFLMVGFLRDLKREDKVKYDLPERFRIEHRGNGTFVAFGQADGTYYEPPKPLAVLGLRHVNGRFDLIHAAPVLRQQQAAPAPAAEGKTEEPSAT